MLAHKILHNFFDNLSASSNCLEYGVTITIIFLFTNQLLSPVQVCEIGYVHRFILSTKTPCPLYIQSRQIMGFKFLLKKKTFFCLQVTNLYILAYCTFRVEKKENAMHLIVFSYMLIIKGFHHCLVSHAHYCFLVLFVAEIGNSLPPGLGHK